ncbi:MAG: DUF2442 domain-containing protein [Candidatus Desantisbacteria bacterium]
MYLSIVDVMPLEKHKLLLTFENKEKRIFDVFPYLRIGEFSKLEDLSLFNTVAVKFDSIEWSNHLDLDPELLYQKSIIANEQ